MSLATRVNGPALPATIDTAGAAAPPASYGIDALWQMSQWASESRLFGNMTPQQAFTLMLICQAEHRHPIEAMRRYDIIQGRPALKAAALQGDMMARGWRIKPLKRDVNEARAVFVHPQYQPDGFELGVNAEQYKFLHTKDNWKNYRDDMLWARLISKACRTLDPGIISGMTTTADMEDMDAYASPAVQIAQQQHAALEAVRTADVPVIGCDDLPLDAPYSAVIKAAVEETNRQLKEFGAAPLDVPSMHKMLCNSTLAEGLETVMPASTGPAVKLLSRVYGTHRDWLRKEIDQQLRAYIDEYKAVDTTATPVEATTADANADPDADYPPEPGSDG